LLQERLVLVRLRLLVGGVDSLGGVRFRRAAPALVVLVQHVVEDAVVIGLRRGLLASEEQSHESSLLLFTESDVEAARGSESSGPAVAVVKCLDRKSVV